MIVIDGSQGEGGGQVLRTALGLSLATGQPFRIERIRAGRAKPGLLRQHLTCVRAAAEIGEARVTGDHIGSLALSFTPQGVRPGDYQFSVGSAGSATLVLQAVLPALIQAAGPSTLTLEGGTHNPYAPPFDFLERAFLPLVNRMGPRIRATLQRYGFYPAGGGRMQVAIDPAPALLPLRLPERGEIVGRRAKAIVSALPRQIAERELREVAERTGWDAGAMAVEAAGEGRGPGNVLLLEVESEHVTEVFTGFGEKGVSAETVAARSVDELRRYLAAGAAVGPHLADQLLIPLALAGAGEFGTTAPTRHATTNMEIIQRFLDCDFSVTAEGAGRHRIALAH